MIETTDLKKSYGQVQALRGVSFTIAPAENSVYLPRADWELWADLDNS